MKLLTAIAVVLLVPVLALAQSGAPANNSNPSNANSGVANEVKALHDALVEQQKQLAETQKKLAAQQEQIEKLVQQLATVQDAATSNTMDSTPRLMDATLHINGNVGLQPTASRSGRQDNAKESPLSFRIGGAEFTPGGFVDFENIFRSTNTGNTTATNFGSIPFNNTVSGHLTEFRSTAQYSRYSLKVTSKFGQNDVTGYLEGDFNGNDPANVFVTANSHTNRLRLYWLDLKRGKWEFLGGQTWGLTTPNRIGVSPAPSDLELTYNEDANYSVGLSYTRATEFRAAYHFNDHFVWAAAIQNPQQFVGAGETIFPFAFNAQLGIQFDAANNPGTPNLIPDFISKVAWDTNPDGHGRNFHLEVGGLMTTAKVTVVPTSGITFVHHTAVGGGVEFGVNADLTEHFRFVASGMYGTGIGRYLSGLAPQVVVLPTTFSGGPCPPACDVNLSTVSGGQGLFGLEAHSHRSQFGLYYGVMYAARNTGMDLTSPLLVKPFIGFGGPNSPNSANRAIQEGSFDWTQTFWKSENYGALQFVTQFSYLTRAPWFVAAGAPKNAHLYMSYLSLRYVLP